MERRGFLAILIAIFVAPFVRFFERFWPRKPRGFHVDMGKLVGFDPQQPFSVSCWFKTKAPKDRSYLFESTSRNKISETTLLEGITDDEWHHFEVDYCGGLRTREPEVYIDGLKPGEKLPPGAVNFWGGSPEQSAKVVLDDVPGDGSLS